ncbi:MAG: hypothetical protein LBU99_05695 [Spirochaetaceae bacterium]|jgi:hypothetical protein|nr:hypothetical protein [Spirochaetaceae bacterium]
MKKIAILVPGLILAVILGLTVGCATTPDTTASATAANTASPVFVKPNFPFPQRVTYASNLMKPDAVTQEQMEEKIFDLFRNILRNNMIVDTTGPQTKDGFRLVIQHNQAWEVSEGMVDVSHINVSESQGYGMMLMAYLAGSEAKLGLAPNEWIFGADGLKGYYDAMLRTVLNYPSILSPHLFTWELLGYPKDGDNTSGFKTVDGVNYAPFTMDWEAGDSATDGDMDIIYSLILADKQWGSGGTYNYKSIALDMLGDLYDNVVHKTYKTLLLGDWASLGADVDPVLRDSTRPSDFILSHLKVYAAIDPAHDWQGVIDATYDVIKVIRDQQNAKGNTNGLLPDFVQRGPDGWVIPDEMILEGEDGAFAYNACRVPWRLGTDYLVFGNTAIGDSTLYDYIIKPMDDFGKALSNGDLGMFGPLQIDGTPFEYTDPNLFTAPFLLTAEATGSDQAYVNSFWTYEPAHEWDFLGLNHFTGDTYSDYIRMIVMITASGNYWLP